MDNQMSVEEKNIGVLLQTCTFVETTRGKYNTDRGLIAGRYADVPGYCVTLRGQVRARVTQSF